MDISRVSHLAAAEPQTLQHCFPNRLTLARHDTQLTAPLAPKSQQQRRSAKGLRDSKAAALLLNIARLPNRRWENGAPDG